MSHEEYWTPEGIKLGEYNDLYHENVDPWGQSKNKTNKQFANFVGFVGTVIEYGCGNGSLANEIKKHGNTVFGFYISEEAIKIAMDNRNIDCGAAVDITKLNACLYANGAVLSNILWYTADKLHDIIILAKKTANCIFVKQMFPNEQKYFKDKVDGLYGYLDVLYKCGLKVEDFRLFDFKTEKDVFIKAVVK